jgi:secreted trypsin-like serine protease
VKISRLLVLIATTFLLACSQSGEDSCEDLSLSSLKIVSGTKCGDTDVSPVVLVELRKDGDRLGYCSGSVIGRRSVLSAAHCVEDVDEVRVKIGGSWQTAASFIQHPDAQIDDGQIDDPAYDLSIIGLSADHTINPLRLAKAAILQKGDEFSIFGFGQSGEFFNRDKTELRSGRMEAEKVRTGYFEASYDNDSSSICFGDSGGPALLVPSGGKVAEPVIIGVASAISPSLPLPLPLPIREQKSIFAPFPLPFPIGGSSCPRGSKTYHASVYNQSAISFIQRYAPDVGFIE